MSSTSTIPNEDARGLGNMGLNLVKMCMMISLTGLMWNCRHVLWQAVFDSGVQLIRTARDASIVSSGVKRARDRLESRELCDLLFKPGPERLAEGKSAIEILLSVHLRNQSVELQQEVLLLIEKVLEVDGAAQLRTAGAERALSEAAREMRGEDQQVKALALVAALQAAAE